MNYHIHIIIFYFSPTFILSISCKTYSCSSLRVKLAFFRPFYQKGIPFSQSTFRRKDSVLLKSLMSHLQMTINWLLKIDKTILKNQQKILQLKQS